MTIVYFLLIEGKLVVGGLEKVEHYFFNNYLGEVKDIKWKKKFAFLGEINSAYIVMKILNFVQEVNRIKNI